MKVESKKEGRVDSSLSCFHLLAYEGAWADDVADANAGHLLRTIRRCTGITYFGWYLKPTILKCGIKWRQL